MPTPHSKNIGKGDLSQMKNNFLPNIRHSMSRSLIPLFTRRSNFIMKKNLYKVFILAFIEYGGVCH